MHFANVKIVRKDDNTLKLRIDVAIHGKGFAVKLGELFKPVIPLKHGNELVNNNFHVGKVAIRICTQTVDDDLTGRVHIIVVANSHDGSICWDTPNSICRIIGRTEHQIDGLSLFDSRCN